MSYVRTALSLLAWRYRHAPGIVPHNQGFLAVALRLCEILYHDRETMRSLWRQRILYHDRISLLHARALCRMPKATWPPALGHIERTRDAIAAHAGTTMRVALSQHALPNRDLGGPANTQPCRDMKSTISVARAQAHYAHLGRVVCPA